MPAENSVSCCYGILRKIAADLPAADLQEVVSGALLKIVSCKSEEASYLKACRWSLADWLRDKTEAPAPIEDTELRRELATARRRLRSASPAELRKWERLLARLPEREREVAIRLAAGYSRRDISSEMGLSDGTVSRTVKAIGSRFFDSQLWHPILDALQDLPDSMRGRGAYVRDLSEYPQAPVARRTYSLARKESPTFVRCWNDSVLVQPTSDKPAPVTGRRWNWERPYKTVDARLDAEFRENGGIWGVIRHTLEALPETQEERQRMGGKPVRGFRIVGKAFAD